MTAVGGRGEPGRLDYFENQGNGTVSLPKIGMNNRSGVQSSQGGRYQTINGVNSLSSKAPIIR